MKATHHSLGQPAKAMKRLWSCYWGILILTPNIKDDEGHAPLYWAARNGHEKIVKLLLRHYPIRLKYNDIFTDEVGSLILKWKLFLPDWRCRGKLGGKKYPKEFKDSAISWLLVGKRLILPKDISHLILEYTADMWRLLPDENAAIGSTKKRIKIK